MIRLVQDEKYNYTTIFNTKTGSYIRFSDERYASYPHLIDIGVMGSCQHGRSGLCLKAGIKCYQNGLETHEPNMSLKDFKRIIDEIKPRTFQCLKDDEVVLKKDSVTGIVSSVFIRDIKVGDYVWDGANSFIKITGINKKTVDSIYKIKLNYNRTIFATEEHRFPTNNGLKLVKDIDLSDCLLIGSAEMQPSADLEIDIVKFLVQNNICNNYYISGPVVDMICTKHHLLPTVPGHALRLEKIKDVILQYDYSECVLYTSGPNKINAKFPITPELMYLLGHYIGNGSQRTYVISNTQLTMIQNLKKAIAVVFPNFICHHYEIKNKTILEFASKLPHKLLFDTILECRYNKEKQLPNIIWTVPDEYKLMFLRGYFCDGNFLVKKTDGYYGEICLNTSSKKLAKDLALLLNSLNIGYSVRTQDAELKPFSKKDPRIIQRKTRYRICVSNFQELQKIQSIVSDHKNAHVFFDMMNSEKQEKYLRQYRSPQIEKIEKIHGQYTVVDINVNSENHLFMTSHGIISHNCALGGRGDPDMHEHFEELLRYSAINHVVPNFTTSGLGMTPEKAAICKAYCGAVAVSAYSRLVNKPIIAWRKRTQDEEKVPYKSIKDVPIVFTLDNLNDNCFVDGENLIINHKTFGWHYLNHFEKYQEEYFNGDFELYRVYEEENRVNYTMKAIDMLLKAGVTTNMHFVLSNTTIDEAILRLKYNGFPDGINAVIFLLHKPVGLGDSSDVLQYDDPRLTEFFELVDQHHSFKIGFDSCTVPGILNFSHNINLNSVDTCEAARFSMYITADMIALPCSFDNVNKKYAFDLKNGTIKDAWDSETFNKFRSSFDSCPNCPKRENCLGGCPLEPSITLCKQKH